jgi:serine/threonine-protein kinase
MLRPDIMLNGRYMLAERIAAGGMGEVWCGVDTSLQRRIAVKVLLPFLVSDSAFITRFRTEARLMAALRHPGIVQVYDGGQAVLAGGTIDYLVMEFIEGTPLSTSIQHAGRLDPRQTLQIVAQAADALQAAHEAGIVHRDVKPSNLLIRPGGAVVLVDFGVARSTTATGITGTNVVMGTAHYMAPEQAEGKPVTPATDVYALGAVAYCCLTGRTPYAGDGPLEVLGQLVYGPSPTLPPDVPPAVADVVLRAMAKDPARRYPSAAALAADARSALAANPAQAARPASARVAFLGHDTPPPATTGRATAPPATDTPGHGFGAVAVPVKVRRRWPVVVALLLGMLVGGVWSASSILSNIADGAAAQDEDPGVPGVSGGRPISAAGHSVAKSPSALPRRSAAATGAAPAATDPAETSPNVPVKLCGNGYRLIDSAQLRSDGLLVGDVYLLADDAGQTCVVTLKATDLGKDSDVSAYLEPEDGPRVSDDGNTQHAGPVRAQTAGACIRWGGAVDDVAFDSELKHCR